MADDGTPPGGQSTPSNPFVVMEYSPFFIVTPNSLSQQDQGRRPVCVCRVRANHFQLPCQKTEAVTSGGYNPASADKFPVL